MAVRHNSVHLSTQQKTTFIMVVIALLLSATAIAAACSGESDCSYNGACSGGTCSCTAPWKGDKCSKLVLGTVDKAVYGYRQGYPYTTSWGGSVVYDPVSQQYIMLVSEYVEQCQSWAHNSATVLATSAKPEGPYTKQFTLFGAMAHEAMLSPTLGPDGKTWVVYFTAARQAGVDSESGPRPGDVAPDPARVCTRTSVDAACTCPNGLDPDSGSKDPTWMSWTTDPLTLSSWSKPVVVFDPANDFTDKFPDGSNAESIDANFNGVINPDGSFVGLWRTWECAEDLWPPHKAKLENAGDECASVPHPVTAADWKDHTPVECSKSFLSLSLSIFLRVHSG